MVLTHNEPSVEVQVFVRKNGRTLAPEDPRIDDVLENFNLEIEKNGSVITATAERKKKFSRFKNMGIYFTIIVPLEMSCKVSSSGGGLEISGVEGTHNFSSSGGSVILENTAGTTRASSSGVLILSASQSCRIGNASTLRPASRRISGQSVK